MFLSMVYFLVLGPVHPFFHTAAGFLLLAAALTVGVWAFTRSVFGSVRLLQREVEELSAATSTYNQRLVSLHAANLALMRETSVEEAFQRIVGTGAELLGACHSVLTLAADGGPARLITLQDDRIQDQRPQCELGRALERANTTVPSELSPGPRLLSVPVAYLGSPIGTLRLGRPENAPAFDPTDEEIARMFGTHAALVIQNDRLYDEVRNLAVEAERQALAREMHDSLAQVLAFVNTKAQAVEQYLRQGNHSEARQQMAELSAAAREVYADIRQGIAALRVDMAGKSLRELISSYVEEFAEGAHMDVGLNWRVGNEYPVPPAAEVQLLRIVQESLANVRRHAGASHVDLTAQRVDGALVIEVRDDGRGFDVAERSGDGRPRFGLQTMQERASAVGGQLTIDSSPGSGTAVTVRLPQDSER